MGFAGYLKRVWGRAWENTVRAVRDHSVKTLTRDGGITIIALATLAGVHRVLEERRIVSGDFWPEAVVQSALVLFAIFVGFAVFFFVEGLFIVPFRLWKEATAESLVKASEAAANSEARVAAREADIKRHTDQISARIGSIEEVVAGYGGIAKSYMDFVALDQAWLTVKGYYEGCVADLERATDAPAGDQPTLSNWIQSYDRRMKWLPGAMTKLIALVQMEQGRPPVATRGHDKLGDLDEYSIGDSPAPHESVLKGTRLKQWREINVLYRRVEDITPKRLGVLKQECLNFQNKLADKAEKRA